MRGLLRRRCWLPGCYLRMRCAMHASLLPVSLRRLTLIMQVSSLEKRRGSAVYGMEAE